MALLTREDRRFAEIVRKLGYANPFTPERIVYEREALGDDFQERGAVWHKPPGGGGKGYPNLEMIVGRVESLVEKLRKALVEGERPSEYDLSLYDDLALFVLYHRYDSEFPETLVRGEDVKGTNRQVRFYRDFVGDGERYFKIDGASRKLFDELPHLFACFFQLNRAFYHIYHYIIGESMPAAGLRSEVWNSIFTYDMARYRRLLYAKMGDVTCLITGQSGTGKELTARAIAKSRYIPFDPKTETFAEGGSVSFFPLNLCALSPTLIESELFGHRRGAFTGAVEDRAGWFEVCPSLGTVFLDEVGETESAIQVKLLRVLETRTFQRLGDTQDRSFRGKIIAATNRDLTEEMRAGRFRKDFFYRLCSDIISTPSLKEQVRDSEEALSTLILFISERLVGKEEAPVFAKEAGEWIDKNLGKDYDWPGNVRELEQCIRNLLIRKVYNPPRSKTSTPSAKFTDEILTGTLSAEDLLSRYCTWVYAQTGTYQETARRLGVDHRTVKSKIDEDLLGQLKG